MPPTRRNQNLKRKHNTERGPLSTFDVHIIPRHEREEEKLRRSPRHKTQTHSDSGIKKEVEDSGGRVVEKVEDADVVVRSEPISSRGRKREGREDEEEAKPPVVTPEWVHDSLQNGRAMPLERYLATSLAKTERKRRRTTSTIASSDSESTTSSTTLPTPAQTQTQDLDLDYKSLYTCQRASPLKCPNQELVSQLDVIPRSRALEGEARSALSYQRAIATIKAFPHHLTHETNLRELPYIGPKISAVISEFVRTGKICEVDKIASNSRFITLSLFASIYGIGPVTARKLYKEGARTIEDVRAYYGVGVGVDRDEEEMRGRHQEEEDGSESESEETDNDKTTTTIGDEKGWTRTCLTFYDDLKSGIPREEVEEIAQLVQRELEGVQPGCVCTVVGGYRRGKQESNSVEIACTHPRPESYDEHGHENEEDICAKLVERLRQKGLVSYVRHLQSSPRRTPNSKLVKAFTIFQLPPTSHRSQGETRVHRRVDLVYAPKEVYGCAVLALTGSDMFQRDVKLWAKRTKGWTFNGAGITRPGTLPGAGAGAKTETERDVFDILGLRWADPGLRNADA